jgi:hypothetical protein
LLRGFPPGYIAALEKRLLETELALFDTLQSLSLLQSSPINDRVDDANTEQERQHRCDNNKVLAKQSITQTKAEKIAEWERLPISTSFQQTEWLKDRLSLVGLTETSAQQSGSKRQAQKQRSASSSDLQQQPFLQTGFMHNQEIGPYVSPGGSSDGNVTRDSNVMMPPPSRPLNVGKTFVSSPESASSAAFVAYRTPTQPPESWRSSTPLTSAAATSSWLRLQDPDPLPMNPIQAEVNTNEALAAVEQTPGGSRAQQLSSSQWRRFF